MRNSSACQQSTHINNFALHGESAIDNYSHDELVFHAIAALWQVNLWLGIYKDAPLVPFLKDFQIESCILRVKTHST